SGAVLGRRLVVDLGRFAHCLLTDRPFRAARTRIGPPPPKRGRAGPDGGRVPPSRYGPWSRGPDPLPPPRRTGPPPAPRPARNRGRPATPPRSARALAGTPRARPGRARAGGSGPVPRTRLPPPPDRRS